jgi:hypothetical protein
MHPWSASRILEGVSRRHFSEFARNGTSTTSFFLRVRSELNHWQYITLLFLGSVVEWWQSIPYDMTTWPVIAELLLRLVLLGSENKTRVLHNHIKSTQRVTS